MEKEFCYMNLTIHAINTGWIGSFQNRLTNCRQDGVKVMTPSLCWLITGGERNVLVDTGMCDTERANRWHHAGSTQKPGEAIHEQLPKFGLKASDIDLIIFTHLHWDHVQNLDKFPRAELVCHEKEWQFAMAPIPSYWHSYEHPVLGVTPPFHGREFRLLKGEAEQEILPGISAFWTPGHSPGSMSVAVETAGGPHVIAGDAVMCYDNLRGDLAKKQKFLAIGRYTDIFQVFDSLQLIVDRAGGVMERVLPGHDASIVGGQWPR
jgi:N-acyl homoserine lactone hydrolase